MFESCIQALKPTTVIKWNDECNYINIFLERLKLKCLQIWIFTINDFSFS